MMTQSDKIVCAMVFEKKKVSFAQQKNNKVVASTQSYPFTTLKKLKSKLEHSINTT
jgi:hypothetical protein